MKSTKLWIALIASLPMWIACTKREVKVTQHDGPVAGDEIVQAPVTETADEKKLRTLWDQPVLSRQSGKAAAVGSDPVKNLQQLEPFILNAAYVENPRLANTRVMRAALQAFNADLLSLHARSPEKAAPWLERARLMIESGCDGELRGCTNLGFFRGDAGSARILELATSPVDQEIRSLREALKKGHDTVKMKRLNELVRVYYRRLSLAFEMRNRVADPNFEFSYLAHAREYATALSEAPESSRERQLLKRHTEIFEIILNRFNPDLSNPEMRARFSEFIDAFSPWTYSRRAANPFGQASTRLLSLAASGFLYDGTGVTSSINSSLTRAIQESQKLTDSQSEKGLDSSFATLVSYIKSQSPGIWRNLKLRDDFQRDEYFFMVDRLFGDHLTVDDVTGIWQGSRRDSRRILETAEAYIKVQIAAQIIRTNKYMSEIYSKKEWSSATLFSKAIELAYPISTQWNQLLSRVDRVQLFLDRNLKRADGAVGDDVNHFLEIERGLSSLRRNIKYLSVYPNMMLMAFFLAEVNFKLTVYTFFGAFEIDSAMIISWFFNGKIRPLFNFGNDGESLTRLETLYAFLFALDTETFKAFQANEAQKLDTQAFFRVVIGKFLDGNRQNLQQSLDRLRSRMQQSTSLSTFMQACQSRDANPVALDFRQINNVVYMGSNTGFGEDAYKFHDSSIVDNVREIRSDLGPKLQFVEMMIDTLRTQQLRSGESQVNVDAEVARIRSSLEDIERLQAEFLTETLRHHVQLSSCIDRATRIENERQAQLIFDEKKHLEDVWTAMNEARALNEGAQAQRLSVANEALKQTLALQTFDTGADYRPLSSINTDVYVYAELDVLLRLRARIENRLAEWKTRVIMPSDITDTEAWRNRRQTVIPFRASKEEFVREGLKNWNGAYSGFIRWLASTSEIGHLRSRVALSAEFYKLGKMKLFKINDPSCADKPMTDCPLIDFRISAETLARGPLEIARNLSMIDETGSPTRDAQALALTGAKSRYDRDKLKEFFLDKNLDQQSLLEWTYSLLTNDDIAVDQGRQFATLARSAGHFLFAPGREIEDLVADRISRVVRSHFDQITEFEAAIAKQELEDARQRRVVRLAFEARDDGRGYNEISNSTVRRDGIDAPVYLARQKIEDFATRRALYNRETNGLLLERKASAAR
jgi:hypothetical protein